VVEFRIASCSSCITRSRPAASSRRATRLTRPSTGPRTRLQTSKPEVSRREHYSARSQNLVTISPTTPAWETSMGKRPSIDWVAGAPPTKARITARPPRCVGPPQNASPHVGGGGLRWNVSYGHTQLITPEAQKSKLMNQALALFLCRYPSSFGHDRFFR
jgi:hypothetical protein